MRADAPSADCRVATKICGLTTPEAVDASIQAGAAFLGFVFYPPSPRHLTYTHAAQLAVSVPGQVHKVAVTVNASMSELNSIIQALRPGFLQLHGEETPAHVKAVRSYFGLPVIKAIPVRNAEDIAGATIFDGVADYLLFDAKPPKDALPGGNGLAFDWDVLRTFRSDTPWFLSGGLNPQNVTDAARQTQARFLDVSSGVESSPGVKDVSLIQQFQQAVALACKP